MLLSQIEKRLRGQLEAQAQNAKTSRAAESECSATLEAEINQNQTISGTWSIPEEVCASTLDEFFARFHMTKSKDAGPSKNLGILVPLELHARVFKFLERIKKHPTGPKNLKEFALMSLNHTLTVLENQESNNDSSVTTSTTTTAS